MILAGLILAAVTGGVILATFWDEIKDWLAAGLKKVQEVMRMVVYGSKVFVNKMGEAIQEIAKHYSQDKYGKWHETTATREISEMDVPKEILAKARQNRQVDITRELELKLT